MSVHRELGPGLREDTYHRSLTNHLTESSLSFEEERMIPVFDDKDNERLVGYYVPDFIVEEKVIAEIEAVKMLDNNHLAQVIGYLAVSAQPVGLLINFAERSCAIVVYCHPKK